jgi:hypothetical protein
MLVLSSLWVCTQRGYNQSVLLLLLRHRRLLFDVSDERPDRLANQPATWRLVTDNVPT